MTGEMPLLDETRTYLQCGRTMSYDRARCTCASLSQPSVSHSDIKRYNIASNSEIEPTTYCSYVSRLSCQLFLSFSLSFPLRVRNTMCSKVSLKQLLYNECSTFFFILPYFSPSPSSQPPVASYWQNKREQQRANLFHDTSRSITFSPSALFLWTFHLPRFVSPSVYNVVLSRNWTHVSRQ
ncbi:hypothetical protein K0M31_005594 [Melipona bicolor]|uniref:Uncharacterized protein n=1 Tax=Melipona bicolor TaxID=60889 RepID=A0AA40KM64_9HYME|nr:hypothetical protein K0M31_005594 [Melipona bicolor]